MRKVVVEGVGLHSGLPVRVELNPAPASSGVVFVRRDLETPVRVPALRKNVVSTQMATTLGVGSVKISTVEHLLAAVAGMGLDNLSIDVWGEEIPILDGSAAPWVEAIQSVGIQNLGLARTELVIRRPVEVRIREKWARVEPSKRFEIASSIEWDHPAIGYQELLYVEGETPFTEIAGARTFGFLHEVDAMRRSGLARGGSMDNAVVLDAGNVLNPEGLRYPDEFIRHKVLDAVGDFQLMGYFIRGRFRLHRSGHDLHAQLLAAVLADPANYEIVGIADGLGQEPGVAASLRAAIIQAQRYAASY